MVPERPVLSGDPPPVLLRRVVVVEGEDRRVLEEDAAIIRLKVDAGREWDSLVTHCVAHGWSGIECLSGIPGLVGAAPIQNIGAYGQELSQVLTAVHVLRISDQLEEKIKAGDCGLAYRHSHFKGLWRGQYVITAIEVSLRKDGPAPLK